MENRIMVTLKDSKKEEVINLLSGFITKGKETIENFDEDNLEDKSLFELLKEVNTSTLKDDILNNCLEDAVKEVLADDFKWLDCLQDWLNKAYYEINEFVERGQQWDDEDTWEETFEKDFVDLENDFDFIDERLTDLETYCELTTARLQLFLNIVSGIPKDTVDREYIGSRFDLRFGIYY